MVPDHFGQFNVRKCPHMAGYYGSRIVFDIVGDDQHEGAGGSLKICRGQYGSRQWAEFCQGVAQSGRAFPWVGRCRRFDFCHSDKALLYTEVMEGRHSPIGGVEVVDRDLVQVSNPAFGTKFRV